MSMCIFCHEMYWSRKIDHYYIQQQTVDVAVTFLQDFSLFIFPKLTTQFSKRSNIGYKIQFQITMKNVKRIIRKIITLLYNYINCISLFLFTVLFSHFIPFDALAESWCTCTIYIEVLHIFDKVINSTAISK